MLPSDEKVPAPDMSASVEQSRESTAPLQNPLHDIYREHLAPKNNANDMSQAPSAPVVTPAPMPFSAPAQQASPLHQPGPTQAVDASNIDAADEAIWMHRAKAVVEQTQNDPYRRLQMIQQLQAQYQSEHFRKDTGGVAGS